MSFQEMIQAVRDRELKVILQAAYMNAAIFMAWNLLPFLVKINFKTNSLKKKSWDARQRFRTIISSGDSKPKDLFSASSVAPRLEWRRRKLDISY